MHNDVGLPRWTGIAPIWSNCCSNAALIRPNSNAADEKPSSHAALDCTSAVSRMSLNPLPA